MKKLLFISRYFKAMLVPYSVWDARKLVYISTRTGHSYDDAYRLWKRFCKHPEAYRITFLILDNARLQGISAEQALRYYQGSID